MVISERLSMILGGIVTALVLLIGLFICDRLDRRYEDAKVLVVYEGVGVEFITDDGNTWLIDENDTSEFNCGDIYKLTFKEYENDNIYDDAIVDYKKIL